MTETEHQGHETLVDQIQNSIFANNGNFTDRTTSVDSFKNNNQKYDCVSNDAINHHQNIPQGPKEQHQSKSTYDYLFLQWKEAIGCLSWKEDTDTFKATIDKNSSDITSSAVTNDSNTLGRDETSCFDKWFHKLWEMHTSYATRHYHTVVHLEEMCFYLQLVYASLPSPNNDDCFVVEEIGVKLSIKSLLLLCIFFHDAVYDVHSSTNEEDSATLFESSFAKHTDLHPNNVQLVVTYILATKHHTIRDATTAIPSIIDSDNSLPYDPLQLFLDIDMSVLGKVPMAYQLYSILIRKEYFFLPPDVYCSKRADILELFLTQSKRIYHTTLFYDAFEQRARYNVQQEIQLLRQGIIPS